MDRGETLGKIVLPPYAKALGMFVSGIESGEIDTSGVVIELPFDIRVQGRPGYLHGGAISGLLEMAAISAIHRALIEQSNDAPIKQINVTIDFMRGGLPKTTYAAGNVVRLGRSMANVEARAWQDDRSKPIATAQMHYLIRARSAGEAA